ncbi:MAG: alpha/beta fold hydrolase [Hyphomicrobiales bacterium]|nr:alpha/beta fold hydrolase [Hyphomicrobiales bacterium]
MSEPEVFHRFARLVTAAWVVLAAALIGLALFGLSRDRTGITAERVVIDGTPATVFRSADAPAPVVLIAHGFAGSQQLMQAFALATARSGMIAVTFDFLGHGRNTAPLSGDVNQISGATRALIGQTARMIAYARSVGDGRVALLGHSMASDIIIRAAQAEPDIAATVAISAFSQVVTAQSPRNLLLIAGEWEGYLSAEALKLVGQAAGSAPPQAGVTYGRFADGTARRFVSAPHVEHVSVLYSAVSLHETRAWLAQVFGLSDIPVPVRSGLWITLLLLGLILAARPLARLLPVVSAPAVGGGMGWRRFWLVALIPAIATPLALRLTPTHFLPILVADYLAVHFAVYGLLTVLVWRLVRVPTGEPVTLSPPGLALAAGGALLVTFGGLLPAIDSVVTSVAPIPERLVLIIVLLAGTLSFFLATEWVMRGPRAARGAAVVVPVAFLLSLAFAVALDLKRLFFLAIIVPVIVPLLAVAGLFGTWVYRRTGHPFAGAIANAIAFALAIGATFPMMTG